MERIKLYLIMVGAAVRGQMQYRASFVAEFLGNFIGTIVDFLAIAVIFGHIEALGGWSVAQVALLYALTSISLAMAQLCGGAFDRLPNYIREGFFDLILIRPRGHFFQILATEFSLRRLGRFCQGALVLGLAIRYGRFLLSPADWALAAGAVLGGAAFYLAVFVTQATASFWTVDSLEVFNVLTFGGNELLSYPLEIYARWLREFFLYVIPLAFINYLPARLILHLPARPGLPPLWWGWFSPLVGLVLLGLARLFWQAGVRHYQGTGS